jgi:hypothetical protein
MKSILLPLPLAILSSPERKILMVSYYDPRRPSPCVVNNFFKQHLF